MELRLIKDIAIISVNFTYAISLLVDIYVKIKSTKNNHPDSPQGGNN